MIVYSHPNCTTCKRVLRWLDEQGLSYELKDIREERPSAVQMKAIKDTNGLTLTNLFNTSGDVYRSNQYKELLPTLSEAEALDLLVSDGMLMKRPIIIDGHKATIGAKETTLENMWKVN